VTVEVEARVEEALLAIGESFRLAALAAARLAGVIALILFLFGTHFDVDGLRYASAFFIGVDALFLAIAFGAWRLKRSKK
jgi:hypothetical protein